MLKLLLIFPFLLIYITAQSQQVIVEQDFGLWLSLKIEKKLQKGFYFKATTQIRTRHNSTKLDNYWIQSGITYKINQLFSLGGYLRYIHENPVNSFNQNNLRYHFDFKFQFKPLKKVKLSYRLRYQQKFIDCFADKPHPFDDSKSRVRHQIKSQWKYHKKHKIYLSGELFVSVNSIYEYPEMKKIRLQIGNQFKTKIGILDIGIGYEQELSSKNNLTLYFARINYLLKL
jgi:hypothetical protein